MDDAEDIIDGAMQNHYDMVKQYRGEILRVCVVPLCPTDVFCARHLPRQYSVQAIKPFTALIGNVSLASLP